ncbi:MAG: anaerobic ribonucleoside-triphosphate reductase activating protein [Spirochaetales bacterium]|nr:anaerobic ribonucleoside-triphosphate reductase activating protein [Spirochaetales bacterium]
MTFSGFIKTDLVNYPGLVAAAVFTGGCNFRCPYCHNPEFVVPGSDPAYSDETYTEEEILAYLTRRSAMLDALVVSGGEPTLHPDLPAFLRRVRPLGLKIKLDTNGSRPAVLKSLICSGLVDYVAMDIKAPFEKYGLFGFADTAAIGKSIGILERSGIGHEYRTTCPKGLLEPDDFPKMAKLIGNNAKWYLQTFNPRKTLDPEFGRASAYTEAELRAIAASVGRAETEVR